MESVIYN